MSELRDTQSRLRECREKRRLALEHYEKASMYWLETRVGFEEQIEQLQLGQKELIKCATALREAFRYVELPPERYERFLEMNQVLDLLARAGQNG